MGTTAPTALRPTHPHDPIARELVTTLHRRARRQVWELDSLRNRFGVARAVAAKAPDRQRRSVIPGYPSLQALLAQEQLAGRLRIAPRIVAYAGEVLTPDMRAQIRAARGAEPFSMYSTTEAGMIASRCPTGVGMHLWEDLALVEVVDEHNRPVSPGVPGHRVRMPMRPPVHAGRYQR